VAVRDRIEYAAYRLIALLVALLPRRAMVWCGRRLGGLYYRFNRRGRRIGLENLRRVFPDREDHAAVLHESLRLQGVAILDALWARRLNAANAHRYLDMRPGHCGFGDTVTREGFQGAVLPTAHYGSWEMLVGVSGLEDLPRGTAIVRRLSNPRIDRHARESRERLGNRLVYREGALVGCLAALRRGEMACSVVDMAVTPAQGGVYIDFLGTPALTSMALPMLAVRRKVPVYFLAARPVEKGYRYVLDWEKIEVDYEADRDLEVVRLAREINRVLERLIRRYPEPWIWTYKRWKYRPTEIPGTYPSYALWCWPKSELEP